MIPKVIHYCWFGGNPLPQKVKEYIESWKKYCPDFEIKEWNENNFDLQCCAYVKEAYQAQKWAFVSDVARLYALVTEGGIYMDTDVEVCKDLTSMLKHRAFLGFETEDTISTGIMAGEKGFKLFSELLEEYKNRSFLNADGSYNVMTNVEYITNTCVENGLHLNNTYQKMNGLVLYPKDYFCPKDYTTGEIKKTENTYTIHHFASSWHSPKEQQWHSLNQKIHARLGKKRADHFCRSVFWRVIGHLYVDGLGGTIQKAYRKLRKCK